MEGKLSKKLIKMGELSGVKKLWATYIKDKGGKTFEKFLHDRMYVNSYKSYRNGKVKDGSISLVSHPQFGVGFIKYSK